MADLGPAFAFGTFDAGEGEFPGLVIDDSVVDLRMVLPDIRTTGDLFSNWDANLDAVQEAVDNRTGLRAVDARPMADLQVLPPVQPVGQIFAAGVNYREHIVQMAVAHKLGKDGASDDQLLADAAAEIDARVATGDPYVWTGIPAAVSGAYDDIQLPDVGTDIDWEAELGVVIGSRAHRVSIEHALDVVAGYTIVNDITARSLVPRPDVARIGTDWFRAKNQPTFFPTGPVLVPARFVADPMNLHIQLRLNGEIKQDSSTANMAFGVRQLISYISSLVVLNPGDVISTGSPAGNGSHWQRFLQGGDVMEVSIAGLGSQRTGVADPSGALPPWQTSREKRRDS